MSGDGLTHGIGPAAEIVVRPTAAETGAGVAMNDLAVPYVLQADAER